MEKIKNHLLYSFVSSMLFLQCVRLTNTSAGISISGSSVDQHLHSLLRSILNKFILRFYTPFYFVFLVRVHLAWFDSQGSREIEAARPKIRNDFPVISFDLLFSSLKFLQPISKFRMSASNGNCTRNARHFGMKIPVINFVLLFRSKIFPLGVSNDRVLKRRKFFSCGVIAYSIY